MKLCVLAHVMTNKVLEQLLVCMKTLQNTRLLLFPVLGCTQLVANVIQWGENLVEKAIPLVLKRKKCSMKSKRQQLKNFLH